MTRHKTQGIIFDYKIAAKSGYLVSRMYIMILGSKGLLPPTRCLRIAPLQSNSRNSINIRNPHIYCVNSYFLMFSGSQVQMSYLASKNDILTFRPWHHGNNRKIYYDFCRTYLYNTGNGHGPVSSIFLWKFFKEKEAPSFFRAACFKSSKQR